MVRTRCKKGAIFDLDNTLINSSQKLQMDVVETMSRLGSVIPINKAIGNWYLLAEQYGYTKEQFNKAFDKRKTWKESLQTGEVEIFPETIQCLEELADEGIIMGLLSKSIPSYTNTKLDYFNLSKYFTKIITVDPKKPSKFEGTQKILDAIGIDKLYLIGDKKEDISSAPQIQEKYRISCNGIYLNRNGQKLSNYQTAKNLHEVNKIILKNER